jgi:hypothetical protein
MKVKLIFDDWRGSLTGESIYMTEKGYALTSGVFHSGTTFDAEIYLDSEDAEELAESLKDGYVPVFVVSED